MLKPNTRTSNNSILAKINVLTKYIYYTLITIACFFAIISIGSYLSVYMTFGKVPSSEDFTAELIGSSGKSFNIFPKEFGLIAIILYFYSLVATVIFILLVLIAKYFYRPITIHKKLLFSLLMLNVSIIALSYATELMAWYYSYILD